MDILGKGGENNYPGEGKHLPIPGIFSIPFSHFNILMKVIPIATSRAGPTSPLETKITVYVIIEKPAWNKLKLS